MTCPLFVELCAGTAALSLRLHRRHARPPVSRMGAKTGYADAILRVLGLRPGQGAARYLWCEPDPGVRLLLEAYRDPGLAQEAAAIIRGWADEEPRALWERLRAEGPPRGVEAGEVARWARLITANRLIPGRWADDGRWVNAARDGGEHTIGGVSFGGAEFCTPALDLAAKFEASVGDMPATVEADARRVDPREVARWARLTTANRLIPATWVDGQWRNTGDGGTTFGGDEFCTPAVELAEKFEARVGDMPATVEADARRVDPREVARWRVLCGWAYRQGEPESGFAQSRTASGSGLNHGDDAGMMAARTERTPTLPATITPDARGIEPGPDLPPGTVAYMDPPYVGTTGYGHDLPRSEVVALARRWSAAGAMVAISEAEPIADLVAEGWHAVRIDGERKGQARTFSKQKDEWLTLSNAPTWTPKTQGRLPF